MKPLHQVLIATGLALVGGLTWLVITWPKPSADWLQVQAPVPIAPGGTAVFRVTTTGLAPELQLIVDLHGLGPRHQSLGVVSAGGSQGVGPEGQIHEYRLRIPVRPDLATVHAIVFVGPTGRWADRLRVAKSEPISIQVAGSTEGELRRLRTHEHSPDPETPRVERYGLRWLLVVLWFVVAGVLASRLQTVTAAGSRAGAAAMVAASLVFLLTEATSLEPRLSALARSFARQFGFYDGRLLPQQLALVGTAVVVATFATAVLIKARNRRLVLGLLANAAIITAAILSLHEMDALLFATIGGIPVEQLLKLAAVSLSLWGLRPISGSA